MFKRYALIFLSLVISIIVFELLCETIMFPSKIDNTKSSKIESNLNPELNNNEEAIETVKSIIKDQEKYKLDIDEARKRIFKEKAILKCEKEISGFNNDSMRKKEECRKEIELLEKAEPFNRLKRDEPSNASSQKKSENIKKLAIMKTFIDTNHFIRFIYTLLIITLAIQLSIAFLINNESNDSIFAISNWAINSPPILGVIGTIYSFADFTLSSNIQKGLFDIFKNNFYDAATTTIIGGTFFVINLAILILIDYKYSKEVC